MKLTSQNNVNIPSFGTWMSIKYNWDNKELLAEKDLNKAYSLINEHYVQRTV